MNIALIGYGKMGKIVEEIALQRKHKIVLKIDIDNQNDFTKENLNKADVAIEFTHPQIAKNNIEKCLQFGTPVVSGTTGWYALLPEVEALCKKQKGSMLCTSNFSVGVNLFFELNKSLAKLMDAHKEYEIEMKEIHHTQKKDAPSGTAITLAEQILQNCSTKKSWVNNKSDKKEELTIISERIDTTPGTHCIKYFSPIDDIEIIHTAHNRNGFALGAVLAAEYIHNKKGVFTMKEVLGI